jgi:hypothetical protein
VAPFIPISSKQCQAIIFKIAIIFQKHGNIGQLKRSRGLKGLLYWGLTTKTAAKNRILNY